MYGVLVGVTGIAVVWSRGLPQELGKGAADE